MYLRLTIQNTKLQITLYSLSINFSEFYNMIMISIIFLALWGERLSYAHRLNISPSIRKKNLEIKKSSKNSRNQKTLTFPIAWVSTTITKALFLEGALVTRLCLHCLCFLSLRSFGKSWGNSYVNLFIARYPNPFSLWQIQSVYCRCSVWKYYH